MKIKSLIWVVVLVIITTLASCNFPLVGGNNSNVDVRTIVAVQVAQTQLAATMNAGAGVSLPTSNLPAEPSATPTNTLTPEPTLTPTLEGVWLTVLENTNCRSGPASYYDYITTIDKGNQVQAVGRNPDNNYYYVRVPGSGGFCWLWDEFSSLSGDIGILPVFTPQPTPTPTYTPTPKPGISVSYKGLVSCGMQYAIRLKLVNTGPITWQSISLVIKDNTAGSTFTHNRDYFRDYEGCTLGSINSDLMPGEEGGVANVNPGQFTYDPTGHHLKISITVYSGDGQTGSSYSKELDVTP
jgi:hypothetical protein